MVLLSEVARSGARPPAPLSCRATDAELETIEATLPNVPLRQGLMRQHAEGGLVRVGDVRPLFVAVVGEDRAAELLAPA
jgi:hypothetical protein